MCQSDLYSYDFTIGWSLICIDVLEDLVPVSSINTSIMRCYNRNTERRSIKKYHMNTLSRLKDLRRERRELQRELDELESSFVWTHKPYYISGNVLLSADSVDFWLAPLYQRVYSSNNVAHKTMQTHLQNPWNPLYTALKPANRRISNRLLEHN